MGRRACSLALLTILVISIGTQGCAPPPDREAAVRAIIEAAEQAAESRDVGAALALVSDDYADSSGRDREGLRQFLRGYFALNPKIDLLVLVESIEFPDDTRARVRLQVTSLTRGSRLALDNEAFSLELFNEDGKWRLQRAERNRY